jgi:hypothetical protein
VIEVEFSPVGLLQLAGFRLSIDKVSVYEEARGRVLQASATSQLPLPSQATRQGPEALPLASRAPPERVEHLPVPASSDEEQRG